jgi:peroxiredoxin Q/BCP
MSALAIGDTIPPVKPADADGAVIDLAAMKGAPLVVYFYPKADTPGCTTEAQDFTRLAGEFAHLNAQVLAVSRDAPAKLCKFRDKYGLTVRLAADEDGAVCEAFGTWVEKQNYGRTYMGIERSTFLFGADGRLAQVWRKVRVKGHADAVLEAAKAL